MAIKQVAPQDAAWLVIESRETPMHVGGLCEFTLPDDAPPDYLRSEFERMRQIKAIPPPWNMVLVDGPVVGPRLPLMRETQDVDLEYHVRHSALPHPGGQRELGMLVSRLHSHQLDLHKPLWEAHLIEGLEGNRFAIYVKVHHSLIDGVSAMRMMLRTLTPDPDRRDTPPFWTVGAGSKPRRRAARASEGLASRALGTVLGGATAVGGLARAVADVGRAAVDDRPLRVPYMTPESALSARLQGQRRFATQQYELARIKALAKANDATVNDIVLYLCGTSLRRYLGEHARLPKGALTAGIPVNLRSDDDQSVGTSIGMMVADLGTNVADPRKRLEAIKRSTAEAKRHLRDLPPESRNPHAILVNVPYMAALMTGLGGHVPPPFSVTISNVPGPTEPLYLNGSRLDAVFPLSLLTHGIALNITCLSYAGTLNFGFTGARDTLPHLQRLAVYMGEALEEADHALVGPSKRSGPSAGGKAAGGKQAKEPGAKAKPASSSATNDSPLGISPPKKRATKTRRSSSTRASK